jgi:hypothetical protein
MGAAHHMPSLGTIEHILLEMDRVTKPDGLVMVMDLARLRTARLTENYVSTLGADYKERGLGDFFEDFRHTMYAVWTVNELRTTVPSKTRRVWRHLVPFGLPTVQVIFGLPVGRVNTFIRPGYPATQNPLIRHWYPMWEEQVSTQWAKRTLKEWKLMRMTLMLARKKTISHT